MLYSLAKRRIMRDHTGCIRAYYRSTKAYYSSRIENENLHVNFGMYDPEGGTSGEMRMEWVDIGSKKTPQLKVFNDGWSALGLFTDLIKQLAMVDSQDINDDEFCAILDRLGFKDITPYEDPNQNRLIEEQNIESETINTLEDIVNTFSEYKILAQGTSKCEAIIKAELLLNKLKK